MSKKYKPSTINAKSILSIDRHTVSMRYIETKWRKGQIAGKYGLRRERKKKTIPYENISDQKLAFPLS